MNLWVISTSLVTVTCFNGKNIENKFDIIGTVFVGPCQQGMARPQVADGGTASDMEGSCEYIE